MRRIFIFVLAGLLFFCSCSYSKIDNALDEKIHNDPAPEVTVTDKNDDKFNDDTNTDVNKNGIIYIEENEEFPDYYTYTSSLDGTVFEEGVKGLTFRFNQASVYDSMKNSPIGTEDCNRLTELISNNGIFENNFVLVDMTAYYEKEDDAQPNEIQFRMDLDAVNKSGEGFIEFHPSSYQNGQVVDDFSSINPSLVYFSHAPKKGDKDLSGNEIDLIHDANICRTPLKSGESLDFQIGILVSKQLVEDNNLFLINRYYDKPEDSAAPIFYVDLLGRFINEENADN